MAKDKGIPLSPKHGVNPSLAMCFWCGKPMGVVLVGRIRKPGDNDAEAPHEACFDLEPCAECRENMAKGVCIVETTQDGSRFDNNPKFALKSKDGPVLWPTGRWIVVNPSAMKQGKAGDRMLCDKAVMDMLLDTAKHKGASKKESAE